MRAKSTLLWIFPALMVFSGVLFYFLPQIIDLADRGFQERKNKGWTSDLRANEAHTIHGSLGQRAGDMAIAPDGTIWVAGSNYGLDGLHYFDGSQWNHKPGGYSDLAVGPNGEVWGAPIPRGNTIEIFDGEQWKTYPISGLDPKLQYPQVEIDTNGRIWYVSDKGSTAWLSEMTIEDGMVKAGPPINAVRAKQGAIVSVDADRQGRVWASVWTYRMYTPSANDGLKVLEGQTWQRVQVPGGQSVKRTVFDSQGDAWIVTECGVAMHYKGGKWETVVEGPEGPDCSGGTRLDGIFVDPRGRLWTWRASEVRFLEEGKWTSLTASNSGIAGMASELDYPWVFGVAVDKQDRVWVGSAGGVSMAQVEDIQTVSEEEIAAHRARVRMRQLAGSVWWVVPSIFGFLWLAAALSVLPGVAVASVLGLAVILFFGLAANWPVPGVLGLYLGILCALLFGLGDKERKTKGTTCRGIAPGVVGWLIGTVLAFGFLYFLALSGAF